MKDLLQKEPVKFALELADIYFSKRVARSAAELAYFLILTFFPILICLNAFIGLLHVDINTLMEAAGYFCFICFGSLFSKGRWQNHGVR